MRALRRFLYGVVIIAGFGAPIASQGQCTNNNTAIAGGAITPACPGSTTVPCVQGGQYALVNVTTGNQYTFATCGATFDTQITLFNNTGGASLGYNDDSGTCGFLSTQSYIAWTATFTGQLRVLVDLYNCANNTTCAPVTITCAVPPPPVTNGNPCGNLLMNLVAACGGGTYSNVGGGNSGTNPAPTCGSYTGASQDVWFRFVAGPLGQVNIQSTAGTMTDGVMAVYTAPSCSGPFTQVACDDDSGPGLMPMLNLTGLNPGQTYYIRFWGFGNATGTFNLCVQGITTVPPGNCVYILNLYDAFADGWGTSNVGVSINGGPFTYYTVTGAFNQVVFGVNIGNTVVLTYNNSGAFQGDNSYRLTLNGMTLFNSGSPPVAGVSYAATVTCQTPPAPPEDCVGSVTICGGQAFNNNTNNTGNVADLNLVSAGCLANLERQGTWYNFSPTTGGQVAFSINPANANDDYDFAIWGPFPPGSTPSTICPPLNAPLRCSYSAQVGATGLNYTATDLTEDFAGDKWVRYLDVLPGQVYLLYISNWSLSGLAFSLNWNLGGGASLDCTQLGVELLDLEAIAEAPGVLVSWTTASEQESAHFMVERSIDGVHFRPLGQVPAMGHSIVPVDYRFYDAEAIKGMNYYRLRQVDMDGSFEHSTIVSAFLHNPDDVLFLTPNPASNVTNLIFNSAADGRCSVELIDARGRRVHSSKHALVVGQNRIELDLRDVDSGSYIVLVDDGATIQLRSRMVVFERP